MDFEKTLVVDSENARIRIEMQGGFFDFGFGDKYRVHSHSDYEFHMAINGDCVFLTESGRHTVSKGDILLVKPYAIHSCVEGTDRNVKMSFCFSFEKKSGDNDMLSQLEQAFSSFEGVVKLCGEKYEKIVSDILFEVHSGDCFSEERLRSYFLLLITGIARDIVPKKENAVKRAEKSKTQSNLYRMMIEEYVNQNYNKEISLSHLAETMHLCEKQTARIIKDEFGMSFRDFVAKIRCGAAEYLLRNTDMSVGGIAEKVGYRTYNGFYNMFVSRVGITPMRYREENFKKTLDKRKTGEYNINKIE